MLWQGQGVEKDRAANTTDPSTLSNPSSIKSTHISLALDVDFEAKTLKGSVEHTMKVLTPGVAAAIFDTSDLTITKAEVDGEWGSLLHWALLSMQMMRFSRCHLKHQ
jgi:leukotriene-A4 hydrolase